MAIAHKPPCLVLLQVGIAGLVLGCHTQMLTVTHALLSLMHWAGCPMYVYLGVIGLSVFCTYETQVGRLWGWEPSTHHASNMQSL